MISPEKWKILTPLQNLPKNVGDLGKLIVAKGFKNLTKVQKIATSGHTVWTARKSVFGSKWIRGQNLMIFREAEIRWTDF